jgi:O-antigen ligase
LSFVLLMLALTVPYAIVSHTYPIPTFYSEFSAWMLYVLLGTAVGWLAFLQRRQLVFRSPRAAIVPLLFGLLLVLQIFLLPTSQPSMNLLGAGFLCAALLAMHTGYWFNAMELSERAMFWGAIALMAGGVLSVFFQLVQLFHGEAIFSPFVVAYNAAIDRRPFGNMAQANHLATYIMFATAAAMFMVQTRRLPLIVWAVLSAIFACGAALTVSRGPWLQTAVIVLGGFGMAITESRRAGFARSVSRVRLWLTPVASLLIFIVVNAAVRWANVRFSFGLAESAANRFTDAGQISPRLALWKYGWTMFRGHPWFGVGWGEFPRFQYTFVEQLGKVELANNSHDIFIDLLAKTGTVGLAIVVLGLGAWLWRVLSGRGTALRVFGLVLLGVLFMHALVEYPQQYMFFLLPAAFVIGLLEPGPMDHVRPVTSGTVYAVLAGAGLFALYPVLSDYHRAEVLYYGTSPEAQYRAAPSTIFGAWGQYGLTTLLAMNPAQIDNKLAMHRQAMTLLAGETVLRRYAVLLALDGREPEALDTVRRLKLFADMLHDWPAQRDNLDKLCDEQGDALRSFKQTLAKLYGPPRTESDDESDGDGDDN